MKYIKLLWDLHKLKRNTVKTKGQMLALQMQKLRNMLCYAYDNSAYYRRTFEKADITADNVGILPLSSFPTIDKALLLEH